MTSSGRDTIVRARHGGGGWFGRVSLMAALVLSAAMGLPQDGRGAVGGAVGGDGGEAVARRLVAQGIEGVWRAETYALAGGVSHQVDGTIFFSAGAWQVLFFVVDEEGVARRGSAEGGSYTLEGDRLTFRHRYNLSGGEAMEGLPASELRMQLRDAAGEAVEPCTIEISTRRLTIHFPSGNRMIFSRVS